MTETRKRILNRLRQNPTKPNTAQQTTAATRYPEPAPDRNKEQRIQRFIEHQQAVHGEVHRLTDNDWINWLRKELPKRQLNRVLVGTSLIGQQIQAAEIDNTKLTIYQENIENWKNELFNQIDVAITGCKGAIAETGSLILWPDANEPRLMSLAPPVHIVILHTDTLHNTFADAMQQDKWASQMPTNALLISGPSKTADIEQTLAYGIHGPKQLITLILEP